MELEKSVKDFRDMGISVHGSIDEMLIDIRTILGRRSGQNEWTGGNPFQLDMALIRPNGGNRMGAQGVSLDASDDQLFFQIPYELTYTMHTKTQLRLFVDGTPVFCDNCDFEYNSDSMTPKEISGVSESAGIVSITGIGLVGANSVTVASIACDIIENNDYLIRCTKPVCTTGNY
jgi:hypothetical protein